MADAQLNASHPHVWSQVASLETFGTHQKKRNKQRGSNPIQAQIPAAALVKLLLDELRHLRDAIGKSIRLREESGSIPATRVQGAASVKTGIANNSNDQGLHGHDHAQRQTSC